MPTGDPAAKDKKDDGTLEMERVTTDSSWMDDWRVTSRYPGPANEKSLARHYVPDHVFIDKPNDEAQLVLYTDRLRNKTQQAGEVYFSEALVESISMRVSARITGARGAVAGFFTYFNDTQESDIELLTRDEDNRVHFSNQPTENATTSTTIPGTTHNETRSGSFREWTVYRLDWLRGQGLSAWYINGKLAKTSRVNVPVTPSTVYINMWSSGSSFSGLMDYGTNATLEIRWIQMAFNASAKVKNDPKGGFVCPVEDGVADPSSAGAKLNGGLWLCAWLLLVSVAAVAS
ncbi:glycoside hydrolase family 16 [Fusarium heterosporum]|uniref:Glycoside hydrolase family 16 n=1 Tax=Fusarium heterosporum TaxID=42747 RepID=A0A8H5U166_FUSHE|nr:glycoside hydrolase family 16 [Fusarium heterosporum]